MKVLQYCQVYKNLFACQNVRGTTNLWQLQTHKEQKFLFYTNDLKLTAIFIGVRRNTV